jgi:two-component system chemotaxis response regulator CheB
MTPRLRVLVVDDSAFARKVLREVLQESEDIEVVGTARDGLDALEKVGELRPDVVTLDLVMPELDGVGVLRELAGRPSGPRVVIVTMTDEDSELGVLALQAGAFDVVHKPTSIATDRLYELGDDLRTKVRAAAKATFASPKPIASVAMPRPASPTATSPEVLVIGASTGGPQAVSRLLAALPKSFPLPVAVVLHMPPGYTAAFAARLDADCALDVVEARDGMVLLPGRVVVARAGMHLKFERDAAVRKARLDVVPTDTPHRPSIDVLFASAAEAWGGRVLAAVLTGMGNDGVVGARAIREKGGRVLTESESSCVVYGMPRAVVEAHLSDAQAPLERMAALIAENL